MSLQESAACLPCYRRYNVRDLFLRERDEGMLRMVTVYGVWPQWRRERGEIDAVTKRRLGGRMLNIDVYGRVDTRYSRYIV